MHFRFKRIRNAWNSITGSSKRNNKQTKLIVLLIISLIAPSYSNILKDGVVSFDLKKEEQIVEELASMSEVEFLEFIKEDIEATKSTVIKEKPLDLEEWLERDKYFYFPEYKHEDIQRYAYILAKEKHMDYLFFIAIMLLESRMRPEAVHLNTDTSMDRGVFQINSRYEEYTIRGYEDSFDVFNPLDNMIVSFQRLSELFDKYRNYLMIAGMWNRGEKPIKEMSEDGWRELQYVKMVEENYYKLHREYVIKYMEGYND